MTHWSVRHADVFDADADGLICSANPNLNLSGGVGGALLLRYGEEMQTHLHGYLTKNHRKFVEPGTVVVTPSCGSPFAAIAHAVAIDAFYDTNADIIYRTYKFAIAQLTAVKCRNIAATCLGCGYGRCSVDEFIKSVAALIAIPIKDVDTFTFVTTNADLVDSISETIAANVAT